MASGSFALPWPQHPVPHYYHNNWVTSIKVLPKWIASKVLPFPHTDPKIWCSITKYGPQLISILHPNKTYLLTVVEAHLDFVCTLDETIADIVDIVASFCT